MGKRNRIGIYRRSLWKFDITGSEKIIRIYYRVSTDKQDFPTQCNAIKTLCKNEGIEYDSCMIYEDYAITGTKADRESYQKLLDDIKPFDIVLVYELSRLWREMSEQAPKVKELVSKNVTFLSPVDGRVDKTTDMFLVNIKGCVNEYEAHRIRQRTKDALAAKKARVEAGLEEWKPRGKDKNKRNNEGYLTRWERYRENKNRMVVEGNDE